MSVSLPLMKCSADHTSRSDSVLTHERLCRNCVGKLAFAARLSNGTQSGAALVRRGARRLARAHWRHLYFTSSYPVTYLTVGALGVLTLVMVVLLPDVDAPTRETKTFAARVTEFRQGIAEVFRTPPIFIAAGIEAVMYLGYGAFLGFLPIYAKNVGLNDAEVATILGAQLVLAMVAKPISGRLSDRVGRIPVVVVGLLLCAVSLPLIFRSESLTAFVLIAPVLGLGVGSVTPVTNALIADLASARNLGAAMGVFGTIWDIGEATGPIVAGFLIGRMGYPATFDLIAAATALVTAGLMAFVRDPKRWA